MQNPSVDILIAVRDRKEYLNLALNTVGMQGYENLRCIVVDDGSSDELEEACKRGSWITYVKTPPRGISHARNVALELSKADLIYVMDSDDMLISNAISRSVDRMIEKNADWVVSPLKLIDREGNSTGEIWNFKPATFRSFYESNALPHPSSLIKRSLIGDSRYDEQYESAVDVDFKMKLLLKNPRIAVLKDPVYFYRRHPGAEDSTTRQLRCLSQIRNKYRPEYEKSIHSTT